MLCQLHKWYNRWNQAKKTGDEIMERTEIRKLYENTSQYTEGDTQSAVGSAQYVFQRLLLLLS